MKDMVKFKDLPLVFLLVILCSFALLISGCSSGGSDSSIANPYAGSSTIGGGINLSSLISSDQDALDSAGGSLKMRYYNFDPDTEAVKLFVIGEDGELEDTGIICDCEVDSNDADTVIYTCPGVKDGYNYIVKYIKLLGNDKAIELKANAYIPEGTTNVSVTVTAQTSAIMECLTTAILDATEGTGIDQDIVNQIITAVKTTIEQLVESGAIQIPSMIVDVDGTTIAEVFGEDTENDLLNNASGTVVSDPNVSTEIDIIKNEIEATNFSDAATDAEKRALIERIFNEMLEDGSVPDFMIAFFTDQYIANGTITVGNLTDAIIAGIEFDAPPPPELDPNATQIMAAFKAEAVTLYDLLDKKAAGTITDAEKEQLADIPPVVMGLFPESQETTWINMTSATTMTVPQAIAYTIYVIDGYLKQQFEAYVSATQGEGGGMEYDEPYDFDPMQPNSIMDALGFFDPGVADDYLSGVDIFELWLHPGVTWIDSLGEDVDALNAGTCWMDLDIMLQMFSNPNAPIDPNYEVTLTYPKKTGGTGTIQLISESLLRGEVNMNLFDNRWVLEPWMEANPNGCSGDCNQPDLNRIVSDFTSGPYSVTVRTPDGYTYSRTFTKKVITGMTDIRPKLVSPLQEPIWPGNDATQAEWDAYYADSNAYVETIFNMNKDTNDDGTPDMGQVTITWKPPQLPEDVVIPEGVNMGYELDIGQGNCDPNGCTWNHIYATWDHDKVLFGTSFTIPVLLDQTAIYVDDPYHVHLHVVFIDGETGRHIGQGGGCHARFWVDVPLDPAATFTIRGPVRIINDQQLPLDLAHVPNFNALLFRETYDASNANQPWTREAMDIGTLADDPNDATEGNFVYTIDTTIGAFIDPNAEPGSWIGIDIFHDIQDNDQHDETLGAYPNYEPQWGPWWDGNTNVWFNTWGGIVRVEKETCSSSGSDYETTIVRGGETVDGPEYSIQLWYDANTTVP